MILSGCSFSDISRRHNLITNFPDLYFLQAFLPLFCYDIRALDTWDVIPLIPELQRQKEGDLCEFKNSMIYTYQVASQLGIHNESLSHQNKTQNKTTKLKHTETLKGTGFWTKIPKLTSGFHMHAHTYTASQICLLAHTDKTCINTCTNTYYNHFSFSFQVKPILSFIRCASF